MDSKLQQFINTWTGILCGDTPENKGQCVGLSELWMDDLNLNTPHEYGNACDLLTNANGNFDVIYNTPIGFPVPGDVMVWGKAWGGGYGHTGVIVTADVNQFTCFEQNNPEGHAPQINGHSNYNGVLGWLHPHFTAPVVDTTSQDTIDSLRTARDTNWNLYQAEIVKNTNLQTELTTCQNKSETPPTVIVEPSVPTSTVTSNTNPEPLPTVTTGTNPVEFPPHPLTILQMIINFFKNLWQTK